MIKKNKYIVLSICRISLMDRYPTKYQKDTRKYPVFQAYLIGDDDVFIVHEDDINNIVDEQDFYEADSFFDFGDVEKITVVRNDTEESADVWIDKHNGWPVGTERTRRLERFVEGLMLPQQKKLPK
jgi:hypothetical protein